MTYAPAAPEFERLPWLKDERRPAPRKVLSPLILWSVVALVLIAGASYWLGLTSSRVEMAGGDRVAAGSATATIALPEPSAAELMDDQVSRPAMPEVEPVPAPRPVTIARPRSSAGASQSRPSGGESDKISSRSSEARAAARASALSAEKAEKKAEPLKLWPASQSQGAAGRAVRIGTFSSRRQAKRGWRLLVRAYPGMGRLQAVVVPSRSLRNGQTYYRLQFGTTSQAHSAVLCQWMRSIAQSCIIIGQPAKASG